MKLRISGIVSESIVDGTGIRTAVFFQGCPHHCEGCHNPQTHDPEGGRETDTTDILKPIFDNIILDGITLTGGEPFYQPQAAVKLAESVKERGLNIWTYTGYTFEKIIESGNPDWLKLLSLTDILADGKFVKAERTLDKPFVGSKNQRLIDVSASLSQNKIVEYHIG